MTPCQIDEFRFNERQINFNKLLFCNKSLLSIYNTNSKNFPLQGSSIPVWIYYRHFLDPSSFFAKPWCSSGTGPNRRATPFLTIPTSFCSFGNLNVFSSADGSSRHPRQYVAVTDSTRITVPKGIIISSTMINGVSKKRYYVNYSLCRKLG